MPVKELVRKAWRAIFQPRNSTYEFLGTGPGVLEPFCLGLIGHHILPEFTLGKPFTLSGFAIFIRYEAPLRCYLSARNCRGIDC